MPVLRRRRGRRPKIDKLLEASALESMIAANSGAANLAGTLSSAGLTAGLNMLWPMAGFEQCLSRLADANVAERNRLLLGESGQPVPHDDVQRTSSGLSGGEHEEQPPRSVAGEASIGGLDLRALLTKEGQHQHSASLQADGEPGEAAADTAEAGDDSQQKDFHASGVSGADVQKESKSGDADAAGVNLTSVDSEQTSRAIGDHQSAVHDHVEEPEELPLKLTASMPEHSKDLSASHTPSRDVSRQSAGDVDEDVMSRLRGSDDVVARWLAEHRNTFDRQGLEDEVQSEVKCHNLCNILQIIMSFELTMLYAMCAPVTSI